MFTGAISQHTVTTTDADFGSFGLADDLLRSLGEIGYEHPTPVQSRVIPIALSGQDVIGLAQTGSGKTAAFGLPMAQRLSRSKGVRGLILSPTREIALQTKAFLTTLAKHHPLKTACVIGGVRFRPQIQDLRNDPDIIVATPGRLVDHMERGNVSLAQVEILVLDEADHMLDLGFLPQIRRVLEELPRQRQTMMFSATMPDMIERLAQQFMRDPVRVDILPEGRAAEGIEHRLYMVDPEDKKRCLMALLEGEQGATLVFMRRKIDAEWASRQLAQEGHEVDRIHSNLSQSQRVAALQGLREGGHRILVATDIAARGIDIPAIEHIINFNPPETVEDYIHRAGRTARGTSKGIVSTIGTWRDKPIIREIEAALGQELPRLTMPGVEPYAERKTTVRGRKLLRRRLL